MANSEYESKVLNLLVDLTGQTATNAEAIKRIEDTVKSQGSLLQGHTSAIESYIAQQKRINGVLPTFHNRIKTVEEKQKAERNQEIGKRKIFKLAASVAAVISVLLTAAYHAVSLFAKSPVKP